MADSTRGNDAVADATSDTPSVDIASKSKSKPRWKLPPLLDHFNAADLKVLFRCSVAAWVASLMMFIHPALHKIGIASFFAIMVLFMVPPNTIVFIYILACFSLILGMGIGWAWGVITMLAAQAARPGAETQAKLQSLGQQAYQQANSTGVPVANVELELVYNGWMLDARVSAVFFCMLCFMMYCLARLRASNPKFILTQIFGTIVMDVYLTVGPMLPKFNGTIPKVFLEPAAIGIGLGLVCQIIFFPTSTSHVVLNGFEDLVRILKTPLDLTIASLCDGHSPELADLQKLKLGTLGLYRKVEPALGFLQLDFSVGRWNADDVKSLKEPLREVSLRSLSLIESHIARIGGQAKADRLRALTFDSDTFSTDALDEKKTKPREAGLRQLVESAGMVHAIQSPEHEGFRKEMLEAIREPTSKVLPICQDAAVLTADSIHAVNSARWFNRPAAQRFTELEASVESVLENLKSERISFATETTERLIQVNADLFKEDGCLRDVDNETAHRLRAISLAMVFEEHIIALAKSWERVLGHLLALMKERKKTRLWLPRGLGYAINWIFRKSAVAPVHTTEAAVDDPEELERKTKVAQKSLRMSRGYRVGRRSGLGRVVLAIYHWLINTEGLYALRVVCVTIALGIPAVIPSSAGFYYRQKGLWALIMGQTTVLVYMSDFTLSLVSRTNGTIIGGVMGLVAWYIGSGNGHGNSYGLAAVMAVMVVILMWLRIFAPPVLLQAVIMGCATFCLVIGYSFDFYYNPQYGNPGVGYNVFWRRLLLVIIGFAAAVVMQFLPRPPSATRHVCKSLSGAVRALTDHYALLLSCWGKPDREEGLVAEDLAFNLADNLSALDAPVALLRFEFSGSPFDSAHLSEVKSLCQELNQHLARLLYLSASLPERFQSRLSRHAGMLDHRSIGDIMAVLSVLDQALKTGDPLPEVLPTPLLKRCLDFWSTHQVDTALSKDLIRDEQYRQFCVAVSAYLRFLATIDDLVLVMKGTLGESHIVSRELMHELIV